MKILTLKINSLKLNNNNCQKKKRKITGKISYKNNKIKTSIKMTTYIKVIFIKLPWIQKATVKKILTKSSYFLYRNMYEQHF